MRFQERAATEQVNNEYVVGEVCKNYVNKVKEESASEGSKYKRGGKCGEIIQRPERAKHELIMLASRVPEDSTFWGVRTIWIMPELPFLKTRGAHTYRLHIFGSRPLNIK